MIACLSIPYFAAAVERRSDAELANKPLAIGGQPWEARPIYAFSQEVAHKGVEIGMSLRLVQVLSPHSHFMPAAQTHYSQVSSEVIDVLVDFSPLIEPQELWHPLTDIAQLINSNGRNLPARYCLDLEGLPEGEAHSFVQEIGKSVRQETDLEPAIGLAAHKFTAQVAATVCHVNHALPVKPGKDASFLASRSLSFLPLEKDMARRLNLLGIRTLGQLTALALPALREQFGPQIIPIYKLARGEPGEPVQSQTFEQQEEAQIVFDGPVEDKEMITAAADRLVAKLAHRLQEGDLQGSKLNSFWEMEDGTVQQQVVTLRRPVADIMHLSAAVQELIANKPITCAVASMKIVLSDLVPAKAEQLTLFNQTTAPNKTQRTIRNLATKYQKSGFYQPQTADSAHPLPERRFHLHSLSYDALVA